MIKNLLLNLTLTPTIALLVTEIVTLCFNFKFL